jgi:DNA-binding Lrp family transcriptional regulator
MAARKPAYHNIKNQDFIPLTNEDIFKMFDDLNTKIVRELVNDPYVSSTDIASKYDMPLSTIQRRRAKLEQAILTKTYNLDVRKLGWRTADLLISVEKGKAEETARKLLENNKVNVIVASLRIGDPRVDIMADIFYKDSIELHELTEKVKAMPYVKYVECAEVVKVIGNNFGSILEKVFHNVDNS